jgi:hypothetical protein
MSDYSSAAVNYEEINSAHEQYDEERGLMTAEVTLRCAYSDRHILAGDICGNLRAWPKGAAGLVPLARGASIVPAQNQGGTVTAGFQLNPAQALVTIHYTTKNQEVVTESYEPWVEALQLDFRLFRWGSGSGRPLREDEAPPWWLRGINFVRNELFVLPPLSTDLVDLVGNTNNATIMSTYMGFTFNEGTLLYMPPTINRKITSIGDVKYDMTKKFSYRPQGWNWFWNSLDDAWEQIYLYGSGSPFEPYPEANFANIISAPM